MANSGAIISPCGLYRYRLWRAWDDSNNREAVFIMLNPSTADAEKDDPTIRRCIAFAKSWGCVSLSVVNLFAFRATKPIALATARDPIGPDNLHHILETVQQSNGGPIVAAWGAYKGAGAQAHVVTEQVRKVASLECLGKTSAGAPRHPLYVPASQPLALYALRAREAA